MNRKPESEKLHSSGRYRIRLTERENALVVRLEEKKCMEANDLFREGIRLIAKQEGLLQT